MQRIWVLAIVLVTLGLLSACDSGNSQRPDKTHQALIDQVNLAEEALPDPSINWQSQVEAEIFAGNCDAAMSILMPAAFSGDTLVQSYLFIFENEASCGPNYWSVPSIAEANAAILSNSYFPFSERILTLHYDETGLIPAFRTSASTLLGIDPVVPPYIRIEELGWLRRCEIPMELSSSRYAIRHAVALAAEDMTYLNARWQQRASECLEAATKLAETYQQADWDMDEMQVPDWLSTLLSNLENNANTLAGWVEGN